MYLIGLYGHLRECALEVDSEKSLAAPATRFQSDALPTELSPHRSRPAISGGLYWGELMQFPPNFTFSVLDNKTVSTSPSRHIPSVQGPVGLEPVELAS